MSLGAPIRCRLEPERPKKRSPFRFERVRWATYIFPGRGHMAPQAASEDTAQGNGHQDRVNTLTSDMTLSARADALEEHMMHELDKIITKSVFSNLTDGQVAMEGGAVLQAKNPGKYFNMGPDPRLPPMPDKPTLMD